MKGSYSRIYMGVGKLTLALLLAMQYLHEEVNGEVLKSQLIIQRQHSPKDPSVSLSLSEGEQIALEVTNQLLPPAELSEKISQELKLIKYKYRIVSKISHQRKWIPGQLISTKITPEQIKQLNSSSEYGPLIDVTTVDLLPFYFVTILSFGKPFNPLALGEMLSFQYGFSSSPNTVYFDGDDIFYDPSTGTYIFKKVPDCVQPTTTAPIIDTKITDSEESCSDKKHYWEFIVSDSGNVRLIKEYDIDNDGNKKFNLRYSTINNNLQ